MFYEYEKINYENNLPFRVFFVSIGRRNYHWHREFEFAWCIKGSVVISTRDKSFRLMENMISVINSNEIHGLNHDEGIDNILVALQPKYEYMKMYFKDIDKVVFQDSMLGRVGENSDVSAIAKHLTEIIQNINSNDQIQNNPDTFKILASFNMILNTLFKLDYKIIQSDERENNNASLERLNRILKYINESYMNKISLEEIAQIEHINKYYLSHFFKKTLGMSLQEYINRVRLDKAIDLLINTDEKVIDISLVSGFSDIKYLNQLLKEEYNCTAVEYRRLYSKKQFGTIEITNNREHIPVNYNECMELINNSNIVI